jgi:hypothetical protein
VPEDIAFPARYTIAENDACRFLDILRKSTFFGTLSLEEKVFRVIVCF